MPAGSTYSTIATTTLGSAATSYTFTGISGSYTDLILVAAFGTDNASSINLNVGNGSIDTGSNFSWTYMRGSAGPSSDSSRGSNDTRIFSGELNTTSLANIIINFQNYSNTTTFKSCVSRFNHTTKTAQATAGLWRSTSAINQIRLTATGNNFIVGSTFTLYGITAA